MLGFNRKPRGKPLFWGFPQTLTRPFLGYYGSLPAPLCSYAARHGTAFGRLESPNCLVEVTIQALNSDVHHFKSGSHDFHGVFVRVGDITWAYPFSSRILIHSQKCLQGSCQPHQILSVRATWLLTFCFWLKEQTTIRTGVGVKVPRNTTSISIALAVFVGRDGVVVKGPIWGEGNFGIHVNFPCARTDAPEATSGMWVLLECDYALGLFPQQPKAIGSLPRYISSGVLSGVVWRVPGAPLLMIPPSSRFLSAQPRIQFGFVWRKLHRVLSPGSAPQFDRFGFGAHIVSGGRRVAGLWRLGICWDLLGFNKNPPSRLVT